MSLRTAPLFRCSSNHASSLARGSAVLASIRRLKLFVLTEPHLDLEQHGDQLRALVRDLVERLGEAAGRDRLDVAAIRLDAERQEEAFLVVEVMEDRAA